MVRRDEESERRDGVRVGGLMKDGSGVAWYVFPLNLVVKWWRSKEISGNILVVTRLRGRVVNGSLERSFG